MLNVIIPGGGHGRGVEIQEWLVRGFEFFGVALHGESSFSQLVNESDSAFLPVLYDGGVLLLSHDLEHLTRPRALKLFN